MSAVGTGGPRPGDAGQPATELTVSTASTPPLVRRSGLRAPGPLAGSTLLRHAVVALVGAVVLWLVTGQASDYDNTRLTTLAAYVCVVAGLTVLTGYNGQVSLGHGALVAVGAYTVALLQRHWRGEGVRGQWVLVTSLIAAVLVAAAVGAVVGAAAARLRGPYLAGATLSLGIALPSVAVVFASTFGGEQGLTVPVERVPRSLKADYSVQRWQAVMALLAAVLLLLLLANLCRSRIGRGWRAVRDDEVAARLSGLHVARVQVQAFTVSAGCAGLAGGLFSSVVSTSASPSKFDFQLSFYLLAAIVLGGLGSLAGAVWGSLLLVLLPSYADTLAGKLDVSPAVAEHLRGNLALAVFGLTLILVMLLAPGGIQGVLRRLAAPVRTQLARSRNGTDPRPAAAGR